MITVFIRQMGRDAKVVEVAHGSTRTQVLQAAGYDTTVAYSVTDADGNEVGATETVSDNQVLYVGAKLAGA